MPQPTVLLCYWDQLDVWVALPDASVNRVHFAFEIAEEAVGIGHLRQFGLLAGRVKAVHLFEVLSLLPHYVVQVPLDFINHVFKTLAPNRVEPVASASYYYFFSSLHSVQVDEVAVVFLLSAIFL